MYSVPQRKRPRSYWGPTTSDLPRASLFESESYFLLGPVGTLLWSSSLARLAAAAAMATLTAVALAVVALVAAAPGRSLFRYVFNDVEQCLTTALFTARADGGVLRVPLRWTFVKHACGKLWTLVSTSETQTRFNN